MNSRAWLNLLLAAVLLVVGLFFYLKPAHEPDPGTRLTDLSLSDITSITVERAEAPTIQLERRTAGWWLTAPMEARAAVARVGSLLDLSRKHSVNRYPLSGLKAADYGLSATSTRVHLNDRLLILGAENTVTGQRYIQTDQTLNVVRNDLIDFASADIASWVSLKLLPPGSTITRLELPGLVAKLGTDNTWTTEPPGDTAIEPLASAWQELKAQWADDPKSGDGGDAINIQLANGNTMRFAILQRTPQLVLLDTDLNIRFHISGNKTAALLP